MTINNRGESWSQEFRDKIYTYYQRNRNDKSMGVIAVELGIPYYSLRNATKSNWWQKREGVNNE